MQRLLIMLHYCASITTVNYASLLWHRQVYIDHGCNIIKELRENVLQHINIMLRENEHSEHLEVVEVRDLCV